MRILILGGGGFLGQKLAGALLARGHLNCQDIAQITLADLTSPPVLPADIAVTTLPVDITDAVQTDTLISSEEGGGWDVIYHLAAVVSGQAEAEFDTGMTVNLMGSLNVFESARRLGARTGTRPILVFTSSIAVYGGEMPAPIEDHFMTNPQTSYGAQKAAAELILTDMSRKGFLDGRGLRLPTISIRPGKPNAAASGFMSSIFREPLQGMEARSPVSPDYHHWYLSPRRVIDNLIHAAEVKADALGTQRCFVLPGRLHRLGDMVEQMRAIAGDAPCELIRWERDPEVEKIVLGWLQVEVNAAKALALGFKADESFADNIRYFLEDDIQRPDI
ncbi:MAG: D-erythronate dehydrogenase [Pseudomonadota bacterium]